LPASLTGERVLTVDELAQQFRVSTKTVLRWRRYGLVSRRFLLDGRRRVGFLQSSVDRFLAHNEERVCRGARFSRLTDEERKRIVDQVRCLDQAGGCIAKVTSRIAQETGQSEETIRYTFKYFDMEHSDITILPRHHQPLRIETKSEIFKQYRRGDSAEALARRFCQTCTSIYRIIKEMRATRIMELPLDSMGNEQFARLRSEKKDREILRPLPESDLPAKASRVPSSMPPYLANLYEVPLLTREQEAHLFRQMNYLKDKASRLRGTLDVNRPKSRLMDQIEKLYDGSVATKNQIIRANLRLVVSIAKRYVGPTQDLFELVSDGGMCR
jgi:RNA polymerase primary sigma factor/RNA polymerase sigma factor